MNSIKDGKEQAKNSVVTAVQAHFKGSITKAQLAEIWNQKMPKMKKSELEEWFQHNLKHQVFAQANPFTHLMDANNSRKRMENNKEDQIFSNSYGLTKGSDKVMFEDFEQFQKYLFELRQFPDPDKIAKEIDDYENGKRVPSRIQKNQSKNRSVSK